MVNPPGCEAATSVFGESSFSTGRTVKHDVLTEFQAFGLVVTAQPYFGASAKRKRLGQFGSDTISCKVFAVHVIQCPFNQISIRLNQMRWKASSV
jgi:hypothetical protein